VEKQEAYYSPHMPNGIIANTFSPRSTRASSRAASPKKVYLFIYLFFLARLCPRIFVFARWIAVYAYALVGYRVM
jgi:hypothetical protein